MAFKSIFRDSKGKKNTDSTLKRSISENLDPTDFHYHVDGSSSSSYPTAQKSPWANLPSDLLLDIISRVEASETTWPSRTSVVFCAAVCKSWREITQEIVKTPEECGLFTFPISLKLPGPRDSPIQCFIRRDRVTSTYWLYLGLSPALSGDTSKMLLAAKRVKKATKTDLLISYAAHDFSQTGDNYAGKLRSNFFGSKFFIHDCRPPCNSATIHSRGWSWKRISSKKVAPRLPVCNYNVATIAYDFNLLRTRGPRRMHCTMHSIPSSAVQEGGVVPIPSSCNRCPHGSFCQIAPLNEESTENSGESLVLRNKSPRWHEQLQCWCLNFRGRVTVASVKNFQLVAAVDPSQSIPASEREKVVLQFGKIGKDTFTLDYRYPLSAFQAFALCLSTFDTKPACE